MKGYLSSEWLKYRRTLTPWIIVGGPLLIALAELIFNFMIPEGIKWNYILLNVHNWWSTVAMPFGIMLLTTLAVSYERRSGAWKVLNTYPNRPGKLYAAKLAALAAHVLVAGALLAIFVFLLNIWVAVGSLPWKELLSGFVVAWLAALGQMAIMLWLGHILGFGLAIVIGFVLLGTGIVMAERTYWLVNPWSWPIRALEPIFGFHANGMLLEPDSPFGDPVYISISIALSVLAAIVFGILGTLWYNRREVR